MTTRAELGEWVRALFRSRHRRRLSGVALETLAIVAYRQPITTPEIQAIRGIDPGGVLETLLEKRLLRVVGRKKVVGKPILYGTTGIPDPFRTELPDRPSDHGGVRGPRRHRGAAEGDRRSHQWRPVEEEAEEDESQDDADNDATASESEDEEDGDDS